MTKNDFEKVTRENFTSTSKIENSDLFEPGDFLSRLWANFGEPDSIDDGGFSYTLKHIPSGLIIDVYSGSTGPAYGGKNEDIELLTPLIKQFEQLLMSTTPVECEVEYDSDSGKTKIGFKDGQIFETTIEE